MPSSSNINESICRRVIVKLRYEFHFPFFYSFIFVCESRYIRLFVSVVGSDLGNNKDLFKERQTGTRSDPAIIIMSHSVYIHYVLQLFMFVCSLVCLFVCF